MATVVSLAIVGGGAFLIWRNATAPGQYDSLAQCLTKKEVTMYGAYWCPHCLNQKKAFGTSWKYITYVECAIRGQQGQTQECTDAGITGYPTWTFPDGTKLQGEQSLESLGEKAGCGVN